MALCYAGWGGFFFLFHRNGVDYTRHYIWTTLYFLGVGAIIATIFRIYLAPIVQQFSLLPFIVFGVFMLVQLFIYVYVPKYLKAPTEYFEKYPNRYYLKLDWRRLVSKSADIAAQQAFIVLLVVFLKDAGLPLVQILFWFCLLFLFLHIPLLASERGRWPMYLFGVVVIVFSIIFPILILYIPYGFIYNIILHWLFYTTVAVVFWTQSNLKEKLEVKV